MSDPSYSDGKLLDTETDGSTVSALQLLCVHVLHWCLSPRLCLVILLELGVTAEHCMQSRAGASGASPKCSARAAPGGRRNQNLYLAGPPRRAVRPAAAAPRPRPRTRTRIPVVCGTSRFACLPACLLRESHAEQARRRGSANNNYPAGCRHASARSGSASVAT